MAASRAVSDVAILTAGKDPHYALGLLGGLVRRGVHVEFVANDEMATSPYAGAATVKYLNLRGSQLTDVSLRGKITRVLRYYAALVRYAASTECKLFHILWFNRFECVDNTLLVLYYRLLGKRLVYTAHNVSTNERDGRGGILNRLSLWWLYRNVDHVFVHCRQMKARLVNGYGVPEERVTVVPFGVNDVTPRSEMTRGQARERLGLMQHENVLLFFGNIAPYKGLDVLIDALEQVPYCRLVIAGRVKESAKHWNAIQEAIARRRLSDRILSHIGYIPEEEVEVYFKAADALVLPYRRIDQSGVIFLSYSFGLPVIASDAGALAESVVEGATGHVFPAGDTIALVQQIETYFASDLFRSLPDRRKQIIAFVNERHSWERIADKVHAVYARVAPMEVSDDQ